MSLFDKSSKVRVFQSAILFLLGLLIYSNTFTSEFHFDDKLFVLENPAFVYFPDWGKVLHGLWAFLPTRIVATTTIALNYYFHQDNVIGYHVVNFLIHLITSLLVWWLARLLFLSQNSDRTLTATQHHISFFSALIFIAHPVHTQAITYISQRCASLATLFYVLSLCLFIKGRLDQKQTRRAWPFFVGSAVSGLLGMFSKEIVISLPIMIAWTEFFLLRAGQKINWKDKRLWLFSAIVLAFLLVIPSFFSLQQLTIEKSSQSHIGDTLTLTTYVLTQFRVFSTYIRLLFLPVHLNVDYDYAMSHSLFDPVTTFLGLLFLTAIILFSLWIKEKHRLISFGLLWFFIALSANLVPRRHVMFEHKLYLASIGPIIAFCIFIFDRFKNERWAIALLSLLVGVASVMTFQRNKVWANEYTLWSDVIKKSPGKARPYINLATAFGNNKDYETSLKYFFKALEITPRAYEALNNVGQVYELMGKVDKALEYFIKSTQAHPFFHKAYTNAGKILALKQKYPESLAYLTKAIEIDPHYAKALHYRGIVYAHLNQFDKALADYNQALKYEPNNFDAYNRRGYVYAKLGRYDKAIADYNKAIKLYPPFAEAYINRSSAYLLTKKIDLARNDILTALNYEPDNAVAHYAYGEILFNEGQSASAENEFRRCVALDPSYYRAYNWLGIFHGQRQEFDQSFDYFNKSLSMDDKFFEGYSNRGYIYSIAEKYEEAIQDFNKALELNPNSGDVLLKRAYAYEKSGRFEEALRDFDQLIAAQPDKGLLYFYRSVVYREMGEDEKADADVDRAKSLGLDIEE